MWRPIAAALVLFGAGCNRATFDEDIIGAWESAGTPSSSALPESLRKSADWSAHLEFKGDGTFSWEIDNADGDRDRYSGTYKVVGYSLDIVVTTSGETVLPQESQLSYTVRQQSTGAIRLPLPQDWTGPSVDYFKRG